MSSVVCVLAALFTLSGCSSSPDDKVNFIGGEISGHGASFMMPTVADGGTMTILVYEPDPSGEGWFFWLADFNARASGDIEIEALAPPEVTVRATGTGGGYLDILATGTGEVLGGVQIETASIGEVRLTTAGASDDGDDWALYSSTGPRELYVRLVDDDGGLLVDETTLLGTTTAGATGSQWTWDSILIDGLEGLNEVTIDVDAADLTSSRTIPVVEDIDEIIVLDRALVPLQMSIGDTVTVCFRAQKENMPVLGVEWSLTISTQFRLLFARSSCARSLSAEREGMGWIRAAAAGLAVEVEIMVVP